MLPLIKWVLKVNYWLYYYFFQTAISKNDLLGKISLLGARHYEGSQTINGFDAHSAREK